MVTKNPKIEELLKFVSFTQEFQKVKRVILKKDTEEWESDADHSWQLAIVSWFIIQRENLSLNIEKVLLYAIIHDLVEIYAGDTYVHATEQHKASKKRREAVAFNKISKQFPEFIDLSYLIHQYEQKENDESIFVYALDKLIPTMNIYLDDGRLWHRKGVTYLMERKAKDTKIAVSHDIQEYWEEFIVILEKNKKKVFAE